jgi:hypothetical protein
MVAEFANYHSWIAWVPIVGLLAVPLLIRTVPAVALAFAGAFVGFVVISLTMPLGGNAEQLGANIAAGLGGGAAVGALIGLGVATLRSRSEPHDASVVVVGFAIGLGVFGALAGGFGPSLLKGEPPDLEVPVLATVAIGGGLGWAIGAALGWHRARNAPSPGPTQRWLLLLAATSIALFGAVIVTSIQGQHGFGPPIDDMTRAERDALPSIAALYCIDVAVAVATLIAVAVRGSATRAGAVVVPDAL